MMKPRSPLDEAGGMAWLPRMLDKIRLHARGELDSAYHGNLGGGIDALCSGYLRIDYTALTERVLGGGADEEILAWCFAQGRELNHRDLFIWNNFVAKVGWNDFASKRLAAQKAELGFADRDDIQTMPQLFDVEEGRK
jgi:gluconokinase